MKKFFPTILAVLIVLTSSCTASREREVEDELSDFRAWVSSTTSNIAERTEEDWQRAKDDFRMRTQELDQKQEHFTDELKQDYQQLKQEFRQADERYEQSRQQRSVEEWERSLLGRWADMATINETNVREAYITFMENVREKRSGWSNEDWEMAKRVLESLNERKSQITGDIPTDDEVKIKALQMEFRTLETAADVGGNN